MRVRVGVLVVAVLVAGLVANLTATAARGFADDRVVGAERSAMPASIPVVVGAEPVTVFVAVDRMTDAHGVSLPSWRLLGAVLVAVAALVAAGLLGPVPPVVAPAACSPSGDRSLARAPPVSPS